MRQLLTVWGQDLPFRTRQLSGHSASQRATPTLRPISIIQDKLASAKKTYLAALLMQSVLAASAYSTTTPPTPATTLPAISFFPGEASFERGQMVALRSILQVLENLFDNRVLNLRDQTIIQCNVFDFGSDGDFARGSKRGWCGSFSGPLVLRNVETETI